MSRGVDAGRDETTFAIWRAHGTDVVQVCGVLDLPATVRLRLTLFGRLDAGATRIVVDVAGVRLLDAGSINVLVYVADRCEERHNGRLRTPGAQGSSYMHSRSPATRRGSARTGSSSLASAIRPPIPARPDAEAHGFWGDEINALLGRLHQLPPDDPHRRTIRDHEVLTCLPHVERLTRRFRGLGEPDRDLNQVATLG